MDIKTSLRQSSNCKLKALIHSTKFLLKLHLKYKCKTTFEIQIGFHRNRAFQLCANGL